MTPWIDAFLPTFALIALGAWLRRGPFPDERLWAGIESLVYRLLLPALLAYSISTVHLASLSLGGLALSIWLPLCAGTLLAVAMSRALGHDHARTTSVVQGGIRFNNFVAFSLASGFYGQPGLALGGIVAGFIVPCAQTLVTLVFVWERGRRPDPLRMAVQIVTNPLIVGCLVGFAFALAGGMPPGIAPLFRSLGGAALALGLLCVGAALSPSALGLLPVTQLLVATEKLVLVPLLTLALALLLGLPPAQAAVATLFMAMPTATTSYVQAKAMGGDAPLMAATITVQHVFAIVTLPLWVLALSLAVAP